MEVIPRTFYMFRRVTSKFHFCQIFPFHKLPLRVVKFSPMSSFPRELHLYELWKLRLQNLTAAKAVIQLHKTWHPTARRALFSLCGYVPSLSNFQTTCKTLLFSEIFSILFIEGEGRSNPIRSSFQGNDFWKFEKSRNLLYNIYRKWERKVTLTSK